MTSDGRIVWLLRRGKGLRLECECSISQIDNVDEPNHENPTRIILLDFIYTIDVLKSLHKTYKSLQAADDSCITRSAEPVLKGSIYQLESGNLEASIKSVLETTGRLRDIAAQNVEQIYPIVNSFIKRGVPMLYAKLQQD
jgi:hypothetical protein